MNKVRRWNVEPDEQDRACSLWNVECEDGEFVEYSDYAKLERENSNLRLQLEANGEIKLPSDKEKPRVDLSFDFHAGWYAYGASIKRLNGLGE